MQRRWLVAVGCIGVLVLLAGGLVGAVGADAAQDDDEFPRAEAGLDQTVEQNASVLLDGSESFSPEGELVDYEWTIETPNGSTISPSCDSSDCSLARFRVPELGRYNVTLTVTDDDGRQLSDTLYVTVVPRGDFGVTLTGPGTTGEEGNLTATVAPGDVAVHNMTWYRDAEPLGNRSLPANGGTFNRTAYIAPGSTFRAVVNGSWNRTASDTWTAPGGSSTWAPANSGEYPRIEGPAVVTGDPDHRGSVWRFDSTAYVLRTSQFGSVRLSTWEMPHSRVASGWYVRNRSLVRPPLEPGINRIRADVDVQRGDGFLGPGEEANSTNPRIHDVNVSRQLSRRLVVDPAPQIIRFDVFQVGDSIRVTYAGEDQYNPADQVSVVIGGTTVHSSGLEGKSFDGEARIDIPSDAYGETPVQVGVVDGRGQTATARGTVTLPGRRQVAPSPRDRQRVSTRFNEEEDQIESESGEVLLKESY